MTGQYQKLLTHVEALRINQDPLGESGELVRRSIDGSYEAWAKALWYNASAEEEQARRQPRSRSIGQFGAELGGRFTKRYRAAAGNVVSSSLSSASSLELPVSNFHPWRHHAVLLLNRASYAQNLTLDFYSDLFDNFMCPHAPPPTTASVRDAWNGVELGHFERTYTAANVPAHGSVLLTVTLVEQ